MTLAVPFLIHAGGLLALASIAHSWAHARRTYRDLKGNHHG